MKNLFNLKHIDHSPKRVMLILACFFSLSTIAGDLQIGASAVKITPPLGTPMAGYYYARGAEKVHDDLYAKALVMEKDGIRVAIVSCDIIEIPAELADDARRLAEKASGIAADHIMIGATHAHTGPVILSPSNMYTMDAKSGELLKDYMAKLPGLMAQSIKQANDALKPATLSYGLGKEETISFNRRFFMKDGTVGWNPGIGNPDIIKPAGPIDPDVSVLYAETVSGMPISTYVNFAVHLDIVSGMEFSADMPYTLSTILGKVKGPEMVTFFAPGCSGNLNHINVKGPERQGGQKFAAQLGTILAGEVMKTYARAKTIDVGKISATSEIVKLPLAEFDPADLPKAREIASKFGKDDAAPFMEMVNAYKIIDVAERKGKPMDAEIQVFALGDEFAIVSLPGEIFTELGMYIKSRSPYPYTMVIELANGSIDYIPDRKAFVEGNYEPVSSRCAPGSGEMLVEHALKILNELKNN